MATITVTRIALQVLGSPPKPRSVTTSSGALYLDLAYEQDDGALSNPILINTFPYHQATGVPASDANGSHPFHLTAVDLDGTDGLAAGQTTIDAIVGYLATSASEAASASTSAVSTANNVISVNLTDEIAVTEEIHMGLVDAVFDGSSFGANWNTDSSYTTAASAGAGNTDEHRLILIRELAFTSLQTIILIVNAETDNVSPETLSTSYYFTIEDLTVPELLAVVTRGLRKVRVQFNEDVLQTADTAISALYVRDVSGGFEMAPASGVDPARVVAQRDLFTSDDVGLFLGIAGADNALNNDIFEIASVISTTTAELAVCGTYPESSTLLIAETLPRAATVTISPYRLEGVPDSAAVIPYFEPVVTGAENVSDDEVELTLHSEITPNRGYLLHAYGVEDLNENAADDNLSFTSEALVIPEGRINNHFDMRNLLPKANQRIEEDSTRDLEKFLRCLDEVLQLLLYDIDTFTNIIDIDLTNNIDAMLLHLGVPFSFAGSLSETDKRRLASVLVDSYKRKGTELGMESTVSYVLGITANVQPYYDPDQLWVLGESTLGLETVLGPGSEFLKYSFDVITDDNITVTEERRLTEIVEWMKPCHTHFVRLISPGTVRTPSDLISITDSVLVELPMEANVSDSIALTDSIAPVQQGNTVLEIVDTVEVTDSTLLYGCLHVNDSVTITDQVEAVIIKTYWGVTPVGGLNLLRTMSRSITVTDQVDIVET